VRDARDVRDTLHSTQPYRSMQGKVRKRRKSGCPRLQKKKVSVPNFRPSAKVGVPTFLSTFLSR